MCFLSVLPPSITLFIVPIRPAFFHAAALFSLFFSNFFFHDFSLRMEAVQSRSSIRRKDKRRGASEKSPTSIRNAPLLHLSVFFFFCSMLRSASPVYKALGTHSKTRTLFFCSLSRFFSFFFELRHLKQSDEEGSSMDKAVSLCVCVGVKMSEPSLPFFAFYTTLTPYSTLCENERSVTKERKKKDKKPI